MQVKNNSTCFPVQITLRIIGGKWKPLILWHLNKKVYRFNELFREVKGISQKMLAQQLREMEKDGLVVKKIYPQIPPKVEYSMSEYGKTLEPVLRSMQNWGEAHKNNKK